MKDSWSSLVLSCAIVVASVFISISIFWSANIIKESIKIRNNDSSAKIVYELVKAFNEKDTGRIVEAPSDQEMQVAISSKKIKNITVGTNPIKGVASAPVLIVEFSDFQCPFTKRFYQQTFPQIDKEYIATGKVKFAYRDFALGFHQFARPAAILARCAGKQGKYWPMFDKLLTGDVLNNEVFKKYVQELNLNSNQCQKCQAMPEISNAVDQDIKEAVGFGVTGTPAFFINGRFVNGAQPFEVFKKIIDEELAKSTIKK